jgi:outer membrane protein OmpA-like peptidoglycan-associated protein/tetratricopeptide (TPR) repeat protein
MRYIYTLLFISLSVTIAFSQSLPPGTYTSNNKKAISLFEDGKKMLDIRNYEKAESKFNDAISKDPNFIEAYALLGVIFIETNNNQKAIDNFKKALSPYYVNNYYQLAELQFHSGQYTDAKINLEKYLSFPRINPSIKEEAEFLLKSAKFAEAQIASPLPIKPINMGERINSAQEEYLPSMSADLKYFIFTRNYLDRRNCENEPDQEDFCMSVNNEKSVPVIELNSNCNEGAPSLSVAGNFMFFAACGDQNLVYLGNNKGYGSCDIFYTEKINGKWTKPQNVGPPINTANWETQPSFSSDGKTLYFVRGGSRNHVGDIYFSEIGNDGKFKEPIKLGDNINTLKNEQSVFVHPDNKTLYFSSNGRVGMGKTDIYMSRKQEDDSWGPAINLGYPINTVDQEFKLVVSPDSKHAYFSSKREGGFGELDLYEFELPEALRPEKITYVKGHTFNAKTKDNLEAIIELIDLETQQSVTSAYSNSAGEFLVTLTSNHNYLVNVSKPGFLFYSDNFSLKDKVADYNKPYQLQIPLQPIDTGIIELKNIFFDVNKADLKAESKAELQKIIAFLKANPTLKVEFSGHTDNSGDKVFNKTLSNNRAKAIYDYVVEKGSILAANLSYKGYGDTKPKAPNDSPENKAKNRRTELKVLAK